jgi:hypothetical protein
MLVFLKRSLIFPWTSSSRVLKEVRPLRVFKEVRPLRVFKEARPLRVFKEARPLRVFKEARHLRVFKEARPDFGPFGTECGTYKLTDLDVIEGFIDCLT